MNYKHLLNIIYSLIGFLLICECSDKVQLGVYIESLCPDSRRFITTQLTPAYNVFSDIIDIDFVPFGNSKWVYNQTDRDVYFECQHGLEECYGNKIQTCLIYKSENDTELELNFIDCMFRSHDWRKPELSGKQCADKLNIDWTSLEACSTGSYGTYLELQMANKTESLNPAQDWIPWITIDGKHSNDIQDLAEADLQELICDSYNGEKPNECKNKRMRDAKYESFPMGRYINKNAFISS